MNYVLAYNLGQMKEGAGRILGVSLVIMGALIVLLILSRIFTSILYQPVKSLNAYVSDIAGVDTEEMDEFSAIRENVVQLVDTKESLQLMVQNQQKILVEQFIIRTIRGEMTPEAVAGAQEQFQLPRARVYQLLTAVCMLEGETDQESELENEALSMTIVKKAPEGIAAGLITPVLCLNGQILLLTGANTQEELREKTMRIHTEFTEFVETEFGCSLISGVSQEFPGLKYLRTAYNETSTTAGDNNGFFTPNEKIDFSKVKVEPLFEEQVDFETFSKSDFRAVKVKACEAVKKSKKLLQFTLDDGTGTDRTILSGIHAYYEPEELVGKTLIAITNLPPRAMMGIDSCGMLLSAVCEENGEEKLNLLMVDNHIPAGAKLY